MSLDPQAAELVLRLRQAGVVGPSQLTVAGARREGLKIGGIWLLDSQSLAIMAHLNRNDRSTTTEVATGAGLEVKVIRVRAPEGRRHRGGPLGIPGLRPASGE